MELLFAKRDLRSWLEQRRRAAVEDLKSRTPEQVLARPPKQLAAEVFEHHEIDEPVLRLDEMTGQVDDGQVDVSADQRRVIFDRTGPFYVDGTRITFRVPYEGPVEALKLRSSSYSTSPLRGAIGAGVVTVYRDIPADVLERDRQRCLQELRDEAAAIEKYLAYARAEIAGSNEQLKTELSRIAEARRKKILADRETESMLGVPLSRDSASARTYRVQPVQRKRVTPARAAASSAFTPEPAITEDDFANVVGDIVSISRTFERLATTYADMDEERLRDQILAMLGNVYGPTTGESFSKRGKSDIYLPWDGGDPVFLAECKWWSGPKAFAEHDLPQLLDRYVVWRDTHAAMVLFIGNKDATAVIDKAASIIRDHQRYVRDAPSIGDTPVFVLHKDGDLDREIRLALITSAINR